MNRDIIKAVQRSLRNRGMLHTPDAEFLANRLEDLVTALLDETITVPAPSVALIELNTWSRIDEVRNYAKFHDILLSEAVERLVNSGLSHEHRGWTS